jgi:hypothetical protein
MPSPFPGMDPYLELPRRWPDFHNDLAAEIRTALNQVLGPRYAVASVYERGAYARKIDYHQPPPAPPLSTEEATWVDALLSEKGIRGERAGGEQ